MPSAREGTVVTFRRYFCSGVKSLNPVGRLESQASWDMGALARAEEPAMVLLCKVKRLSS